MERRDRVLDARSLASVAERFARAWRVLHSMGPVSALRKEEALNRIQRERANLLAAVGELAGQLTGRVPLINRQRLLETTAPAYLCSAEALAREVGFRATTTVADGTAATARWYREHGWT